MNNDDNLVVLKARVEEAHGRYVKAAEIADTAAKRKGEAREALAAAQRDFERAVSGVRRNAEPWVA